MAQPIPPTPSDAPRPLPRRDRPQPKPVRPRFQALDGVWLAGLALLASAVGLHGRSPGQAGLLGVIAALLYGLGWRTRDRAAGVIAGLLFTTALPLIGAASVSSLTWIALTLAALLAFVGGSSLVGLLLAAISALLHPFGIVLGLTLLGLSLAQRRSRARLGALLFLVVTLGGLAAHGGRWHPGDLRFGLHLGVWAGMAAPEVVFLTWFLLALCPELTDAARRARWLPTLLWTGLYLVSATFVSVRPSGAQDWALLPFWSLLVGGGIARLLPLLTNDLPRPAARYALSTVAVAALIALRLAPVLTPRPKPVVATAAPMPQAQPPARVPHPPAPPRPAALHPAAAAAVGAGLGAVAAHHAVKAAAHPAPVAHPPVTSPAKPPVRPKTAWRAPVRRWHPRWVRHWRRRR